MNSAPTVASEPRVEPPPVQSRMGSVFRQSSVILASSLLLMVGGYFFKIYLARTVGADGLGLFALGESLISFLLIAVTWQFGDAVFRFNAQFRARQEPERMRRLLWASVFHVLLLGVLVGLALFLTRKFWADVVFHATALASALVFFAVMLPARALEILARMIARSYKEIVRVVSITTLIAFPLKIVVSVVLITMGFGLYGWLTGETLSVYVSVLLLLLLGLHLSPARVRRPLLTLRQETLVYSFSATMIGRSVAGIGNARLGTLLLGIFLTTSDVGIYGTAMTTAVLVDMLQSALNGAFAPHIAELHATGQTQALARMYYRVTRWDLMGVLPIAVIMIVLAEPLLAIFGPTFVAGAPVLVLLALGELVNVGSGPVGMLLTMGGKERTVFWMLLLQLAINTMILLLLLPSLGLIGAALGFSISTMVFYATLYHLARRSFPIHLVDGHMLKLLGAAALLGACALLLRTLLAPYVTNPAALLVIVSAVLAGIWAALLWLWLLDSEDRIYLGEALRGVRARFALAT